MKSLTKLLSAAAITSVMSAAAPTAQADDFLGDLGDSVLSEVENGIIREFRKETRDRTNCALGELFNRQTRRCENRSRDNFYSEDQFNNRRGSLETSSYFNNCSVTKIKGSKESVLVCSDAYGQFVFNVRGRDLASENVGACNIQYNRSKASSAVCDRGVLKLNGNM